MFKKILTIIIISGLILSQAQAVLASSKSRCPESLMVDYIYEIATDCYKDGDLEEALYQLNVLLAVEPGNPEALRLIAKIEEEMGIVRVPAIVVVPEKKTVQIREEAMVATLSEVEQAQAGEQVAEEALPVEVALKKNNLADKVAQARVEIAEKPEQDRQRQKLILKAMEDSAGSPETKQESAAKWIAKPKTDAAVVSTKLKHHAAKGEILIDGQTSTITPALIKGDDVWLSLTDVAGVLDIVIFDKGENKYNLIRTDGLPLELTKDSKDVILNGSPYTVLDHFVLENRGEVMINLEDLSKILSVEVGYDADNNVVVINTPHVASQEFLTFTQPKPKQVTPVEVKKPVSRQQEDRGESSGRLYPTPAELEPDTKVNIRNYATYSYNNLTGKGTKSEHLYISGRVPDYTFDAEFEWKDKNTENLDEYSKFIGIYGKDTWYRFLNLSVNLFPLRSQSEGYKGIEITKFYKPFTTRIYAGERDVTVAGPEAVGQVRYFGNIFGLEQTYDSEAIDCGIKVIGLDAAAETPEKLNTTSFPRKNLVTVGDVTLHTLYGIDLFGQYAFCNYYSDDSKEHLVRDHDWRLGAEMNEAKAMWRLTYEYVGSDYASIGDPSIYKDYKGWDLYSRYRFNRLFSVYGNYRHSRNNIDDDESLPTSRNKSLSIGSNYSPFTDTTFNLNLSRNSSETEQVGLADSGSVSYGYMLNMFRNWKEIRLQLGYGGYDTDSVSGDADSHTDTYIASVYKFLPQSRGSYIRARQEMKQIDYEGISGYTSTQYTTDVGYKYYLARSFSTYGNIRVSTTERNDTEDTVPLSFNLGGEMDINKYTSLGIDFNFSPYDLDNSATSTTRDWSILFRVSHEFGITSPAKWGEIIGRVFIDENGNGEWDKYEKVLPNILVSIPKENVVRTDLNGFYIMEEVSPGRKTIELDEIDLPIELTARDGFKRNVNVGTRQIHEVDFALVEYVAIRGRVFVDENANGIYDIGEEGIEGINIALGPQYRVTTTDENGKYGFEYLTPGVYTIELNPANIPLEYKLISDNKMEVELLPREEVSDADFTTVAKSVVIESF